MSPESHSGKPVDPQEEGFRYYRDHKKELVAKYRGKWVTVTVDGVIATADSYEGLYCKVEEQYPGIRSFHTMVRTGITRGLRISLPSRR